MKKDSNKLITVISILLILFSLYISIAKGIGYNKALIALIWFFISFFISNFIHEIGHFMVSIILDLENCIFYCYPLLIRKCEGEWTININLKYNFFASGFVMPNISVIKSMYDYKKAIKKLIGMMIAGPITSFIFAILCILLNTNFIDHTFSNIIAIMSFIIGVLTLLFGDGYTSLILIKNNNYALKVILSFDVYSSNYFKNSFLYSLARESCEEINFSSNSVDNILQIEIQTYTIYNCIINKKKENNKCLIYNMKRLFEYNTKNKLQVSQINFYIHTVIAYMVLIENDIESANRIYETIVLRDNKLNNMSYLSQRTRYLLSNGISFEEINRSLEENNVYYISDNYINIEKKLLVNKK